MTNTFADALGCDFKRVQFTPDLLPADITGTNVYDAKKGEFTFKPGPLFCNLLLADEINRAPPKTQAALLEAMQEKQVTIGTVTHKLPAPFIVMATQNPVEQEGTYPLPEAQTDRFMLKTIIDYPTKEEEVNLNYINTLKEKYPYLSVGFSNHYNGLAACIGATALGAECLEFHITKDRTMYGSDQVASIESVTELMVSVRKIEKMLGDGKKVVYDSEVPIAEKLRKVESTV